MCGISGLVNLTAKPISEAKLIRMNSLISHRGPDGDGIFVDGSVGFAHRRLAIVELNRDGLQPMHYHNQYVIVFNGELYNYLELREELLSYGVSFSTKTDTEVILAAYHFWGESCVSRFNGMWSFAILDQKKHTVFCSRDRFGIKPFYYRCDSDELAFGSEIKQLVDSKPEVNRHLLIDYLVSGMADHTDETFFSGIRKLPASHNLTVDLASGAYSLNRYYTIKFREDVAKMKQDEFVALLRHEFDRSIRYRLRSDVRVGTCLSGGLDSSTVACVAVQQLRAQSPKEKFQAITAVSTEPATDETEFAKAVVDHLELNWARTRPTSSRFIELIEEVVYTQEEPFSSPSIFMQYEVMAEANRLGCKVMLDGQAGDETLLGYQKYYPSAYLSVARERGLRKAVMAMRQSARNNSRMGIRWIFLYTVGMLFAWPRKTWMRSKCRFVKPEWWSESQLAFMNEMARSALDVFKLQKLEIESTNLPMLLRYEDKNSMRHSIEARLPFLDFEFVETALSGKVEHKIQDGWTKYALRKMMSSLLPQMIVWRKDNIGFNAPEHTWLSAHMDAMKQEISESSLLRSACDMSALLRRFDKMDLKMKWRLYNIAVWQRIYQVNG